MSQSESIENTRSIRTPLDVLIEAIAGRFGDKSKEVERFLRFATVGSIGAILDFTTLNVLQSTVLPPEDSFGNPDKLAVAVASTIAFIVAIISNFTWHRFWTFPDSRTRKVHHQMMQFALISTIGWIGRTIWISLAFAPLGNLAIGAVHSLNPETTLSAERIGTIVAWFIGVIVVMIWNFTANRLWTYNDIE